MLSIFRQPPLQLHSLPHLPSAVPRAMAAIGRCALLGVALWAAEGLLAQPKGHDWKEVDLHRHVIALPKEKLAFCFIQKVASEHFGPMFNALNNISGAGLDPDPSSVYRLGLQYSDLTKGNGWRFAMFVRHPLERYLSAFLSKCVPTGGNKEPSSGGKFCHGPTRSAPVTLDEKVALFEERAKSDLANGLAQDDHWLSQHTVMQRHCGAEFEPAKLDFLGHMTYDLSETNSQVQELLKLTSVPSIAAVATEHFPLPATPLALVQCPTQHCTRAHREIVDFYRNPETVRNVMKLFKDDFDNYDFPVPDFAKKAL